MSLQEEVELQKITTQIKNTPLEGVKTTFSPCPECGLIHPPLRVGEKCPNAPVETGGKKIDLSKFFVDLKNIFVSQIEIKKIKDTNKLLAYLTIEVTKLLENYME